MDKPIKTISEYINAIETIVENEKQDHSVVMFRGESQEYSTPCQPNIFRTKLSQKDKFFEKNLEKWTYKQSYPHYPQKKAGLVWVRTIVFSKLCSVKYAEKKLILEFR